MFKKSLIALTVLSVTGSFGIAQANTTEFNDPTNSFVGEDVSLHGSTINAKDITITVKDHANGLTAYGPHTLTATGDVNVTGKSNGLFTPTEDPDGSISITTEGNVTVKGAWAVHAEGPGKISIKGKTIKLEGGNGIASNSTQGVHLEADTVTVAGSEKYGISSANAGGINITAKDISIKGGSNNAINGLHGNITLNASGSTVVEGDILAKGDTAKVTASFNNAQSSLTGAVHTESGTTDLTFKDQAKWTATGESHVSKLTLNNGVVELNGQSVTANTLGENSTATIIQNVGEDGTKPLGSFAVSTAPTGAQLTMGFAQSADVVTPEMVKQGSQNITLGGQAAEDLKIAPVKGGLVAPETIYDNTGKVLATGTNDMMVDTLQLVSMSSLSLNRILDSDLRQRMGDLRQSQGTHGAWVRYDGGRLSGNQNLETDFHTLQVGIDTVPTENNVRFGLAGSYTMGESDFARGEADLDAFSLSAYTTWMADNGLYTDVVARLSKASNDLTVDRNYKGSVDSVALGLSGELGWRFNVTDLAYIEPQVELAYTYIDGEKFTLTHGTTEANYELDAFDSLTARAGVLAGYACPNNKGDLYVRASAVHEFKGDAKLHGVIGEKSHSEMIDGKDTWIEYGFGGNFNLTPNTYIWADIERTSGASIETDYRASIGLRHAF